MKRALITGLFLLGTALPALAEQKLSTRPNGSIRISASAGEVTRLTVLGDRIRRIIKDDSQFQEMNDEATGDVFLRYAGDQAKLAPESGYIITERGVTISYELTPKSGLGAETVIITVNGMPDRPGSDTGSGANPAGQRSGGFELAAGEGSGGYASSLVAFTRAAIDKHVARHAVPSRGHGTVVASESGSGMRARVIVVAGGRIGRFVRPQDFFNSKVLAVWVERSDLAPNTRAWVVVVERR